MKSIKQTPVRTGALNRTALALALAMVCGGASAATVQDPDSNFTAHVKVVTDNVCGVQVTPAGLNAYTTAVKIDTGADTSTAVAADATNQADMLTKVEATGHACTLTGFAVALTHSGKYAGPTEGYDGPSLVAYPLQGGGFLDAMGWISYAHVFKADNTDISAEYSYHLAYSASAPSTVLRTATNQLTATDTEQNLAWNYAQMGTLQGALGEDHHAVSGHTSGNINIGNQAYRLGYAGVRRDIPTNTLTFTQSETNPSAASYALIGMGFAVSARPVDGSGTVDRSLATSQSIVDTFQLTVNLV